MHNGISFRSVFCPPAGARPGGVVGAPPAGRSRFLSLGGPLPGSLRGVRVPPGASAIARSLPDRRDPACTLRSRRDRAVTAVIAVIVVIAGIILLGPVQVAPHDVHGVRASRDLRAGRDRRDPSRLSRSYGGHGPTAVAVIAQGPCLP